MRKLFLILIALLGLISICNADVDPRSNAQQKMSQLNYPNQHVSMTVFQSTFVNVITSSINVIISSVPVELHTVTVLSTGTKLEIWDSMCTTTDTANSSRKMTISNGVPNCSIFDTYFSSGLMLNSSGGTIGNYVITFRQR